MIQGWRLLISVYVIDTKILHLCWYDEWYLCCFSFCLWTICWCLQSFVQEPFISLSLCNQDWDMDRGQERPLTCVGKIPQLPVLPYRAKLMSLGALSYCHNTTNTKSSHSTSLSTDLKCDERNDWIFVLMKCLLSLCLYLAIRYQDQCSASHCCVWRIQ